MSRIIGFIISMLLLFLMSCVGTGTKENTKQLGNSFSQPYNNLAVEDVELYNAVFNKVKEDIIYYVVNSMSYVPEIIGVLLEVHPSAYKKQFEDIMSGKIDRAWSIVDNETIPVSEDDIYGINNGNMDQKLKDSPQGKYFIRINNNLATIYVKLMILNYQNYNLIYTFEKGVSGWKFIKSERL